MLTTLIDIEANAAYTRQRVAEVRAQCSEHHIVPTGGLAPLLPAGMRARVGAGLIALGERISGASISRRVAAPAVVARYPS